MNYQVSPYDIELLSAYLDQEMDPVSRRRLEDRLKSNPELRAALRDLQQIRQILRAAPRYRAPRNFTLTPQMAGIRSSAKRPARRIYPVFQFASALASFLFVLVLLGDLVSSISLFGASAPMMMEAREQAVEVASTEEVELKRAGEQDMLVTQATPTVLVALGEEAPTQAAIAGSPMILSETPAPEEAASMPTATPELTATPSPTPTITPTETPLPPPSVAASSEQEGEASFRARIIGEDDRISWRLAEILLAFLAIGTGFMAVFYRRRVAR
jgi:anti-sigma factor RsiW